MKQYSNLIFSVLFLLLILNTGFSQNLEQSFQDVLDSTYLENKDALGILIHVESPTRNISWTSSVGYNEIGKNTRLNNNQPVLIASNTKSYVSATILKLVENNYINLDQSIQDLLMPKTIELLKQAGYDITKISIRHLLSHTSGITDYVDEHYFTFVKENPTYNWTREEQIEAAMKIANPLIAGESFAYADINYLLLTEIIESLTDRPFYLAIRELLEFEKHNLNCTWFVELEEKPASILPFAHQYSNKHNWDSYDLNPSWDLYGGGGQASTTKDLALFFQLLFEGKIIKDKSVLSEMYTYVIPKEESRNYCLGLYNLPSFYGDQAFYHGGFWGTDVMYLPSINTTICVFTLVKEKRELNAQLSNEIVKIIKK